MLITGPPVKKKYLMMIMMMGDLTTAKDEEVLKLYRNQRERKLHLEEQIQT